MVLRKRVDSAPLQHARRRSQMPTPQAEGSTSLGCESDAGRTPRFDDLSGGLQLAAARVDQKLDDGVTVFVRGVEMVPAWVEAEKPRLFALHRFPADVIEHAA